MIRTQSTRTSSHGTFALLVCVLLFVSAVTVRFGFNVFYYTPLAHSAEELQHYLEQSEGDSIEPWMPAYDELAAVEGVFENEDLPQYLKSKWSSAAHALKAKPLDPNQGDITLVTALFQSGSGTVSDVHQQRSYSRLYATHMPRFLKLPYPKVIYATPETAKKYIEPHLSFSKEPVKIIEKADIGQIMDEFPLNERVQQIRNSTQWIDSAGWLRGSPEVERSGYLPIVLSKPLWLDEASKLNPHNTDYFMWLDLGWRCLEHSKVLSESSAKVSFKRIMDQRLAIATMPYRMLDEAFGYPRSEFEKFTGNTEYMIDVARTTFFGGRREALVALREMYLRVLKVSLAANALSREDAYVTVLHELLPDAFAAYDLGNDGECAFFFEAAYGLPRLPPGAKYVDFRGLKCERDATTGRDKCFYVHSDGTRTACPAALSTHLLILGMDEKGNGQGLCQPEAEKDGWWCTVSCRGENEPSQWGAHNNKYCKAEAAKGNPGACPERNKLLSFQEYAETFPPKLSGKKVLKEDFSVERSAVTVRAAVQRLPSVSIGILCWKEMDSLLHSLETYARNGLYKYADEVILYFNERTDAKNQAVEKYTRPPYNLKVMGTSKNVGLTHALNWLVGNSTSETFLFLEKDFNLITDYTKLKEQMDIGKKLLAQGVADVIKYRSRYQPGDPNWADIMFHNKEDSVFGRQPNLLCNFYHWLPRPDWWYPNMMYQCHTNPVYYCSTAYYCNWTNNPSHFYKKWWMENYYNPPMKVHNAFDNLEYYMNWEEGAWNSRPWIVAYGDGNFEHHEINEHGRRMARRLRH